jgi:aspartate racemase
MHIAEVGPARLSRGFRRLGPTERSTRQSEVYPRSRRLGAWSTCGPTPTSGKINRIIMEELVYGVFKPEAVGYFQKVMGRLKSEGCDAVVLGCTEIPLIMNDANSPLPTLDSTRLLARAALRRAVKGVAAPI